MMATADETVGGLAEVAKAQQLAQTQAYKQTTEQLQQLSSKVKPLSKSVPPKALLHGNDAPALRLPDVTSPVFRGRENLDPALFNKLPVSFSHQEFHQVLCDLPEAANRKRCSDIRCPYRIREAEKIHQNLLDATPDKASPSEFSKYFDACVETLRTKRGKLRVQ